MGKQIEVYFRYEDFASTLNVYIFSVSHDGARSICTDITNQKFEVVNEGGEVKPTFVLSRWCAVPFMQAMADTLHEHGFHPSGKPIHENELTAVKYHLEDMRKLVFTKSGD